MLAQVLPWASNQRWFPSTWPAAGGAPWQDSFVYRLPHSQILLARPYREGPWLQMPLVGDRDATDDPVFWEDWFAHAELDVEVLHARLLGKEQSNSSADLQVFFAGQTCHWIGKIFRIVYPGDNPDVSVPLQLAQGGFAALAPIRAFCVFRLPLSPQTSTSGVVTDFVANDGTAYDYFVAAAATKRNVDAEAFTIGRLLGELHAALPRSSAQRGIDELRERLVAAYRDAEAVTDQLPPLEDLVGVAGQVTSLPPLSAVHGDLHLGQILHSAGQSAGGHTWTFIDFEGEPLRPLTERSEPDYALRDLAGLLRSVDYAGAGDPTWVKETQAACIAGFHSAAGEHSDPFANAALLRVLELEKALYEVKYEALFRPEMLPIPLRALRA